MSRYQSGTAGHRNWYTTPLTTPEEEGIASLKFNPENWKPYYSESNESNGLLQKINTQPIKGTTGKPWPKDPLNIHGNKYNLKLSELKDQEGKGAFSRVKGKTTIDNKTIWDKEKFDQLSSSLDLFMRGISMAGGKGLLTRR